MDLLIRRMFFTEKSTIGALFIDNINFGWTLELPWKDNKHFVSCIPEGRYRVEVCSWNPKRLSVLNVPGRDSIEMHVGNYPKDSTGCILVGHDRGIDMITDSAKAIEELISKVKGATEEAWLTIEKTG